MQKFLLVFVGAILGLILGLFIAWILYFVPTVMSGGFAESHTPTFLFWILPEIGGLVGALYTAVKYKITEKNKIWIYSLGILALILLTDYILQK